MTNKFLVAIVSLSTLLIGQSVWAVNKLQNTLPTTQPVNSVSQTNSTLGLVNETNEIKVGQPINVDLFTQVTDSKIQALDAVIIFDKNSVTLSQITPLLDSQTAEYPQNKFDNNTGKAWVSTVFPKNTIDQKTNIARLTFTALKSGSTEISFDFQKGKTTDSNVVLENQTTDSLETIQNLTLEIPQ